MKKIIVIGKRSFIGSNLYFFLKKKKLKVKLFDLNKFLKLSIRSFKDVDYIINCSIHKNYLIKRYDEKKDFDFLVAKKISNLKIKQIFLSSRRVYKPQSNIFENSKLSSNCLYSKNKIITEKKLIKILQKKLLILRISNIIGLNLHSNSRKIHQTFINIFIKNIKKNIVYDNKKIFKDFLSIDKFLQIFYLILIKNFNGIYNVSIGKKVYLNDLISWLNHHNSNKVKIMSLPKRFNKDAFFLNNSKLKKKIGINIELKELELYCKKLSKLIFKKV